MQIYLIHSSKQNIQTGVVPDKWKVSFISPIFKNGDRSDVENYRGISKLPIVSKVLELIIVNKISPLINNVLNTEQHGFCAGRSTLSNLLCYESFLSSALENRSQVDSVYTDFSKAFDKVNHKILIKKLVRWVSMARCSSGSLVT